MKKCEILVKNFFSEEKAIKEIRGAGLLLGLELETDIQEMIKKALKEKVLLAPAANNVVRILPPLNIEEKELIEGLKRVKKAISS